MIESCPNGPIPPQFKVFNGAKVEPNTRKINYITQVLASQFPRSIQPTDMLIEEPLLYKFGEMMMGW